MKKYEIVKLEKEFNNIINNGKYIKNNYFVIYYKERNYNIPRFGLAVGKKLGNAVARNKIKRQVRTIIDDNKKFFNNNKDYIIMVKKQAINLKYNAMFNELSNLIKENYEKTN